MNGTRGWSPAPLPRAPLPVTSAEKGPRYTPDSPVGAPRLLSRPTWSPGSESSPPTNQPTHRAVRVARRVVRFVEVRATTDRVRVRDAGRRDGSARSRTACRRRNAWALRHAGEDQQRFKVDEVFQAGAILLGRVTYEIFRGVLADRSEGPRFADRRASPDSGRGSGCRRDPNRPGYGHGHRPRLRLARLGEPSPRPRRMGAVQRVGRVRVPAPTAPGNGSDPRPVPDPSSRHAVRGSLATFPA